MPSKQNSDSDYEAFSKAFIKAHQSLQKQLMWQKLKSTWVEIKPIKGDRDKFNQKMSELDQKAQRETAKKMSYWVNLKEKQTKLNIKSLQKEVELEKEVEKPSQSFQEMEVDRSNETKEAVSSQEPVEISEF